MAVASGSINLLHPYPFVVVLLKASMILGSGGAAPFDASADAACARKVAV